MLKVTKSFASSGFIILSAFMVFSLSAHAEAEEHDSSTEAGLFDRSAAPPSGLTPISVENSEPVSSAASSVAAASSDLQPIRMGDKRPWSLGLGVSLRIREEVNPDLMEARGLPHLFVQRRFWPYAVELELGRDLPKASSVGNYRIQASSWTLSSWVRRHFREPIRWSPFVNLGGGAHFDQVKTEFGSSVNQQSGRRLFMGLGGGISHTFWDRWLTEADLRFVFSQDRKDVAYVLGLRTGVVF